MGCMANPNIGTTWGPQILFLQVLIQQLYLYTWKQCWNCRLLGGFLPTLPIWLRFAPSHSSAQEWGGNKPTTWAAQNKPTVGTRRNGDKILGKQLPGGCIYKWRSWLPSNPVFQAIKTLNWILFVGSMGCRTTCHRFLTDNNKGWHMAFGSGSCAAWT